MGTEQMHGARGRRKRELATTPPNVLKSQRQGTTSNVAILQYSFKSEDFPKGAGKEAPSQWEA